MILADANLWIFALDERLPEHASAKAWMQKMLTEHELLIPAAVEMEVMHYAAGAFSESEPLLQKFLGQPALRAPLDHGTLADAWPILMKERPAIGARDAAILVHARRHDATLASHDTKLLRAGKRLGLRVTDPISRALKPKGLP